MSLHPALKLCFIPFYGAPSHTFSLTNIARYFAFHGQKVTILATQYNDNLIQKLINNDIMPSGNQIDLRIIPLPFEELAPDQVGQYFISPSKADHVNDLLRDRYQKFLEADCFDCIISDVMFPWTADVASHLQIPCISFNPCCVFSECIREALRSPDSPHHQITSTEYSFVIPGLPVPVTMTMSELPPKDFSWFSEQLRAGELKCDFILSNTFNELESDNIEHISKVSGRKFFAIGPVSEINRKISGGFERGPEATENKHECLSWLDSKEPNSVLYVSFGSILELPDAQLMEIASALESSGYHFIWVALGKEEQSGGDEGKWLPIGFHEKIKDRGLLLKSWAPQLSILEHPSVGGFLTHCGWNSLLEGICASVPMITWPLSFDQFQNEKLVTQVLGIGVEVGAKKWHYWYEVGKKIIERENIELAIQTLMHVGVRTHEMRIKAQKYGKMAKGAVDEGGSTHRAMMDLIEEVRKLRSIKK